MNNRGADYIKRLLKDKERFKKWKRIMLALSCVVVFITVYALTIPAVTLACDKEEHVHTTECYDENNELICTKEEHTHSEDCYEKEEQEQDPVEEEDEDVVQDETQVASNEEMAKPEEEQDTTESGESNPSVAEGYNFSNDSTKINQIDWYYIKDSTETKIDTDGSIQIPGDATIKLSVSYHNIQIDYLKTSYNSTLLFDLPKILRNAKAQGSIMSGTTNAGNVTVINGKVNLQFNEAYLNKLLESGTTTIDGNFYVTGEANLSSVPENGTTTITIAGKDYILNFGKDPVANYGKVNVEKSCEKVDVTDDFIKYTIKVTAGDDGCPDVKVVDTFSENSDLISYINVNNTLTNLIGKENNQDPYETIESGKTNGSIYLGTTASDTNPIPTDNTKNENETGSLVWNIGNMEANETRTLTYFAKLKDGVALNGKTINNQAIVYSKSIKRVYSDNSFTPDVKYDMKKDRVGSIVRQTDGSYKINYKLYFKLKEKQSNYPIKDLVFFDYLNYEDNFTTNSEILKYVKYDQDSIQLFKQKKGESNPTEIDKTKYVTSWSKDKNNYVTNWDNTENPACFKVKGSNGNPIIVNPGDSYFVTYTLIVQPEAFATIQTDCIEINNRFLLSASNVQNQYNWNAFDRVFRTEQINTYKWDEKSVESATTQEKTITMSNDKYVKENKGYSVDTSTDNTFKVPKGSYLYTVMVNDTLGDWDVTSVQMTDKLNSNNMQYVGYLKIEALEETKKNTDLTSTEQSSKHINTLDREYVSKGVKWVKIDSSTSFTLKPNDLGWKDNKYAYRFTYYAMPVNQDSYGSTKVTNTFTLTGEIGRGNQKFNISNISSNKEVTITGNYQMNVKKSSWYYESPTADSENWSKGKIYWVVEVSGTAIKEGTIFKDTIAENKIASYLYEDSLVGIYKGKLADDKTIESFENVEEFLKATTLVNVKEKFTDPIITNKKGLSITTKDNIDLKDDKLYMIIASEPSELPTKYREYKEYGNQISTNDDGKDYRSWAPATKTLCGGADILKELGQTFTYDGKVSTIKAGADLTNSKDPDPSKICEQLLNEHGAYISWAFKVNYAGDLKGTYQVLENIPDVMELSYIRIKWHGDNAGAVESMPIDSLGTDWEVKSNTTTNDNNASQDTTYYYNKTKNQAMIKLGGFVAGKERDTYSVDVQVVCKVTDSDVLHGIEKTFTNEVELQTDDGQTINKAVSSVPMKEQNLEKTMKSSESGNEKVSFIIKANPLGQTIPVKDGTTLKLIDKLSSTLILDSESIKAIDSNGEKVKIKSMLKDDNTLELEIPNDKAITITYDATVNAPPGQKIDFSNEAYWEGYMPSTGVKVEKEGYFYTAGGTVSSGNNIKLNILKKDQNDLSIPLAGAEFTMVECERLSDGKIKENNTITWSGTTNEEGILKFGSGSENDHVMNYNTIYKVTETKAPSDYVNSKQPYYIMVPRIESGKNDYSDYVKECLKDNRIEKQYQETYVLTVKNHKGEITVVKKFINDAAGKSTNPVSGTYSFGLYDNAQGNGDRIQTQTITYNAGKTQEQSVKFINLELGKTYYVFELDDNGKPIVDSSKEVTINKLQYTVEYKNEKDEFTNAATNGQTVTVTNRSRTKILPSTGGYGSLLYRISGAMLALASLIYLTNIYKKNHLDDTSKKRRKK